MAIKVIYARVMEDGKLASAHHGSCFGSISTLYHGIPAGKTYDRRILVSTNFNGKCARIWAEAFKRAYPDGLTFRRGTVDVQVPLPKIKYYGVNHKSVGINKEMNDAMIRNGSAGYWQLTLPSTVTEYGAYAFVKLFCKTGSMPTVTTEALQDSLLKFDKGFEGDWRKMLFAMGAMGHTQGYSFPVGPGTTTFKDTLLKYLGGVHIVKDLDPAGRTPLTLFGSAGKAGSPRMVSTSVGVMPNLWNYNTGLQIPTGRRPDELIRFFNELKAE